MNQQIDDAVKHYKIAVSLVSDKPEYYLNLGNALSAEDRIEESKDAYLKAIEIDPKYPAYYNLGNAQFTLDEVKPSIESYKKALELEDGYYDVHFNLATAYKKDS